MPGEGGTGGTRARRLLFSLWNIEKKTPVDGKTINRKRLQVLFFFNGIVLDELIPLICKIEF